MLRKLTCTLCRRAAQFLRRRSSGASVASVGPPALGGGTGLGVPPGRGGHTASYLPACHLGVGGILISGGTPQYDYAGNAPRVFPLDSSDPSSSVTSRTFNAFQLLLVVCPKCGCPCSDFPRRYCTEHTCGECVLYCPIPYLEW